MGLLRVAVLGSPEVFHDGSRLTFALRKAQALLLYLAVEGGLHPRSKLAALLWPDSELHDARTALRNALALLRSLLDDADAQHSHLLSEHELLGLNPQAPLELDLQGVQQAWKAVQALATAPAEPQRSSLVAQVQHALSLVRGPFLDGFWLREETAFDAWHEQQQRQWQVRLQFLLDRLSSWQEAGGELEQAKATLTRWLALDPLAEEAYRRLMRVHLALGETSTALQVYATCRARLAEALQIAPSADTIALAERIRATEARSPGNSPSQPATAEHHSPSQLVAPLVGRAAAFSRLVGSLRRAQQGQPQAVLVVGEAGIGKTRLASEFVTWARAQGAEVLSGQAFEMGGRLPYQPLVEALRTRLCARDWKRRTRRRICWTTCGWPSSRACYRNCGCAILICRSPPEMSWRPRFGCLKRWPAFWTPWRSAHPWCCSWMICTGWMGPRWTWYATWDTTGRSMAAACCCWARYTMINWSRSRSWPTWGVICRSARCRCRRSARHRPSTSCRPSQGPHLRRS